ncbi:MAG: hypothetical protein A3J12_05715 [Omnitrophica bacterium RIFCSPLOWO2_02_FULL_44_11]|nr:MAG: hypothetical protein A3B72_04645 [Omnitrophica bacterium RIFCSPHIGHO2_02_FULL_45_28]OGX05163.1 MAG: hypothetical protein A3J12_05715 [Omnitrophica bacterium RIFCSPLOWO2_02_FULL_44_11]
MKKNSVIVSCLVLSLLVLFVGCKREASDISRGKRQYHRGSYDRAIRDFNLALKVNPQSAEAYCGRGLSFLAKGDRDRAIADFAKAIEISPLPQFYYARGLVWQEIKDDDKAIKDYTSTINVAPDYWAAYINRAQLYKNKKEFDRAIVDYNKAIELSPGDIKAYSSRADAWYEKGDYKEAVKDYTKILETDKNNVRALYDRGIIFYETREVKRAIDDFEGAIQLKPDYVEVYNNYAWILATCVEERYRDGKKAVTLAKKAVQLRKDTDAIDTLAAAYAEAGDFEAAIQTQKEFINTQKNKLTAEDLNEAEKQLESYQNHKPWRDTKIWAGAV